MTAFEVSLNGKLLCTAGLENGVVTAILDWVNSPGANPRRTKNAAPKEFLSIYAGGLNTATEEHVVWRRRNLKVGDSVSIQVVDVPRADKPRERRKRDPKQELRAKKLYVRDTAKELGWEVVSKKKPARQKSRKRAA